MTNWSKLIVIQPWFSALGHPAQSTLNFSRVIPRDHVREFLISSPPRGSAFLTIAQSIARNVPLRTFTGYGSSLRLNTLLALRSAIATQRSIRLDAPALLFIDADLWAACSLIGAGLTSRFPLIALVLLAGPESISRSPFKRGLLQAALRSGRLRLLLRSTELVDAWRAAQPDFADALRLLPPLEGISADTRGSPACGSGPLKIGVIGQVRIGKCIPQLLRIAERHPEISSISVHGPLYQKQPRAFIALIRQHPNVDTHFIAEEELLQIARRQDYLSGFLEPDLWDTRMESATFWLGIKTGTPILCFDHGWIGRMVRETGCGIALRGTNLDDHALSCLPRRDSAQYLSYLDSIARLRKQLTPEALWRQLQQSLKS